MTSTVRGASGQLPKDSENPFHHVILTRFNCSNSRSSADREISIRSRPGWLEGRFDLFERFCLPSLHAQSMQDFRWHIYFDRHTPARFLERASNGLAGKTNFFIKLCDIYGSETVQADLPVDLDSSKTWLVTTRLDNDDALHRDFVKRLHEAVRVGVEEAINFPCGVVYAAGRLYRSRQDSNAFISLSESFRTAKTVLCGPHNEMGRSYPVRNLAGGPAWVQVVHGSNVSNAIRGWRFARSQFPDGFESSVSHGVLAGNDSIIALALDNATLGSYRHIRDRMANAWRKAARSTGVKR
jgi:Putative rhamnosyl transferase